MRKLFTLLFLQLIIVGKIFSVQTVGLFLNSTSSLNGYTLFAPLGSTTTYLINNCGEKVHSWTSNYKPGQSVYLLENGMLLRTGNTNNSIFGTTGGVGGIIEMIDWNNTVVWSYPISTTTECQHHDIQYLPNGNILAVVWELKTSAEATAAGRTTLGTTLWSDKIVEIKPDLVNGGGSVVWEWKAWDHLVQDENASKSNYGVVANSAQLIDLNYYLGAATGSDWLHGNSVDYNAKLDQIVISCHNFSEIWIIDHSTTMSEAASHAGGTQGKGGDLLYRWGNPIAYNQGTTGDQKLFLQHNANWIDDSYKDGGMIMVFNNQAGGTSYSTVNVIETPVNTNGSYNKANTTFAPTDFQWTYKAATASDFYANNISGATRLSNGNTLICSGTNGTFFEVDYSGNTVWKYVNPVKATGVMTQGTAVSSNLCFRAERYAPNFAGLTGKTLTSTGYIETGSTFTCTLNTAINEVNSTPQIIIYPNPAQNELNIKSESTIKSISISDVLGRKMTDLYPNQPSANISLEKYQDGIYVINSTTIDGKTQVNKFTINK